MHAYGPILAYPSLYNRPLVFVGVSLFEKEASLLRTLTTSIQNALAASARTPAISVQLYDPIEHYSAYQTLGISALKVAYTPERALFDMTLTLEKP